MQVGLIGLPQAGKKTLLRLLTRVDAQAVAGAGKAPLKSREYIVEDGDILNFRFSV